MATPDSEGFNIPLDYINEYVGGESIRLQQPLDDALIRAKDNALADNETKSVVLNIVPEGATVRGATSTANWTQEVCREYLYPPGDSTRMQGDLNNRMTIMGRSASNNFTVTSVIIAVGAI
jgi:hypothetical protein